MRPLLIALAFLFTLAIEVPPAAAAPRGYTCGPSGCYPVASAPVVANRASACSRGQCGVARGGWLRRLLGR